MENQGIVGCDNIISDYWNGLKIVGYCRIGNDHFPIIEAEKALENTISCSLQDQLSHFELNGQILAIVEAENSPNTVSDVASFLTGREMQIAALVAKGNSNKQIANQLSISIWTVSTHLRRIFVKLGVDTRAAMVYRCIDLLF